MLKRLFYILLQRLYEIRMSFESDEGTVLMFHKVNYVDDNDLYSISKNNFNTLIREIIQKKKIVTLKELIQEKKKENVVITFDDAFDSVYYNALPILKEYDVPYYVFICNEYLDKPGYLSRDMIIEMKNNSKCIVGSHALSHKSYRFINKEVAEGELEQSKKELEEVIGSKINTIAFPHGSMYSVSKENIESAKKYFENVLMTYRLKYNNKYTNIIPRLNINNNSYRKELL